MKNFRDLARKKKKVTELFFEYEGEKYNFHVIKPMGKERHLLSEAMGGILGINKKQEQAKKNNEEYALSGEDVSSLLNYKEKQLFILSCNEKGHPAFSSMDEMLNEYEPEVIDLMCASIDEHTGNLNEVKQAEKN